MTLLHILHTTRNPEIVSRPILLLAAITIFCLLPMRTAPAMAANSDYAPKKVEYKVTDPVFSVPTYIYQTQSNHRSTLILVHGIGDEASTIWDDLLPELAATYHIVAFDLPGFGRSNNKQNLLYSPQAYSRFLKWVVEQYGRDEVTLLGHSMGGALALHFAGTYPKALDKLILVDAIGVLHMSTYAERYLDFDFEELISDNNFLTKSLQRPLKALSRSAESLFNKFRNEKGEQRINTILHSKKLRSLFLGGKPSAIAALAATKEDFSSLLETVQVLTLIIWGQNDTVAPMRTAVILQTKLSNSRLEILENAGHVPMRENKNQFIKSILKPQSIPSHPTITAPIDNTVIPTGICKNQNNMIFSGRYQTIEIVNCKNIILRDVIADSVIMQHSEVTMDHCTINSPGIGLHALHSKVTATNLIIQAETAVHTRDSLLDFAAVDLQGSSVAIQSPDQAVVIFSVCRIKSPFHEKNFHGIYRINSETQL